jgi:hypothetical protein
MILRLCTVLVRIQDSGVRRQVRGRFLVFARLIPPQRAINPSPACGPFALNVHNPSAGEGPSQSADGLVKAPVAGHPLPKREGNSLPTAF